MASEHAQRTAMGRQFLDIEHPHAMVFPDALMGEQREIRKVLVIDRVELVLLDQPEDVRPLDGHHAVPGQKGLDAGHEAVEVGHLGQNVVAGHQISLSAFRSKRAGKLVSEKLNPRRNADLDRGLGHVCGRLDAEAGYAVLDEVAQEIAVIAGEFDHEAPVVQTEARNHLFGIVPRVRQPGVRVRGEIGVLGENLLRGYIVAQLNQETLRTHPDVEGVEMLDPVQLVRRQKGLAER